MGVIPLATYDGEIELSLNFSEARDMKAGFYAASAANGTGDRLAILFFSHSIDGGQNFSEPVQIGDSNLFENAATAYQYHTYSFPGYMDFQHDIILRMEVTRGDGSGTVAQLLIDDFEIYSIDSIPPEINRFEVIDEMFLMIVFSEPVDTSAENLSNYTLTYNESTISLADAGRSSSKDTVFLELSEPMLSGETYTISVDNITDFAGNKMLEVYEYPFYFNAEIYDLAISEIFYMDGSAEKFQFLEIKNVGTEDAQMAGLKLSGDLHLNFPDTLIQPGDYLLLAKEPDTLYAYTGADAIGWEAGMLSSSGGYVLIENSISESIVELAYHSGTNWPIHRPGTFASVVLCNPDAEHDTSKKWGISYDKSGTINGANFFASPGTDINPPVQNIGKILIDTCEFPLLLASDVLATCATHNWNTGSDVEVFEADTPGTYLAEISNRSGSIIDTFVTQLTDFSFDFHTDTNVVCKNEMISFEAAIESEKLDMNRFLFNWNFGDGSFANGEVVNHIFDETDTFIIESIANYGACIDTAHAEIIVKACDESAIESLLTAELEVVLYPNPFKDHLYIRFNRKDDFTNKLSWSIMNLAGKEMKQGYFKNSSQDQVIIRTDGLDAGLYIFSVLDASAEQSLKSILIANQ